MMRRSNRNKTKTSYEEVCDIPEDIKENLIKPVAKQKTVKHTNKFKRDQIQTGPEAISSISTLKQTHHLRESGPVTGLTLSEDGLMLATFCSTGCTKLWSIEDGQQLVSLRDKDEENIDEVYVGRFGHCDSRIAVAGKCKDRYAWSEADNDNQILPCAIKIYDVVSGVVVAKLERHSEEVLSVSSVRFHGEQFLVSTGQDGYIYKWHMKEDWSGFFDVVRMQDDKSCMVFAVTFLPQTGNEFFAAACDDTVKVYNFDTCQVLQAFGPIYSFYCDCVVSYGSDTNGCYILTRGVESLDAEDNTINSTPNSITLHRLDYNDFSMMQVARFRHQEYRANSWGMHITTNGKYVAAGTYEGRVLFFDIDTGNVEYQLHDHDEIEVRALLFHPWKGIFISAGDDGSVKIYENEK